MVKSLDAIRNRQKLRKKEQQQQGVQQQSLSHPDGHLPIQHQQQLPSIALNQKLPKSSLQSQQHHLQSQNIENGQLDVERPDESVLGVPNVFQRISNSSQQSNNCWTFVPLRDDVDQNYHRITSIESSDDEQVIDGSIENDRESAPIDDDYDLQPTVKIDAFIAHQNINVERKRRYSEDAYNNSDQAQKGYDDQDLDDNQQWTYQPHDYSKSLAVKSANTKQDNAVSLNHISACQRIVSRMVLSSESQSSLDLLHQSLRESRMFLSNLRSRIMPSCWQFSSQSDYEQWCVAFKSLQEQVTLRNVQYASVYNRELTLSFDGQRWQLYPVNSHVFASLKKSAAGNRLYLVLVRLRDNIFSLNCNRQTGSDNDSDVLDEKSKCTVVFDNDVLLLLIESFINLFRGGISYYGRPKNLLLSVPHILSDGLFEYAQLVSCQLSEVCASKQLVNGKFHDKYEFTLDGVILPYQYHRILQLLPGHRLTINMSFMKDVNIGQRLQDDEHQLASKQEVIVQLSG
ncbi:hypothetical protein MP228_006460 [Amoeboaphelidium protococcarum]|nr:hypothetical protein MP228_006460 [Amoeboaphelidium protococcarum]